MQDVYSPINEGKKVLDFSTIIQKVYFFMAAGLAVTGITAVITTNNLYLLLFSFQHFYILAILEVALVLFLGSRINKMGTGTCAVAFFGYAILNGFTLAPIFLVYTQSSIAVTFLIAAGVYIAGAIYGKTTNRSLTSLGAYLTMGLCGIIVASLVNLLIRSNVLDFFISLVGVALFIAITAVDTSRIYQISNRAEETGLNDAETNNKISIACALTLYLDFINIFLKLLRFFGKRKR